MKVPMIDFDSPADPLVEYRTLMFGSFDWKITGRLWRRLRSWHLEQWEPQLDGEPPWPGES